MHNLTNQQKLPTCNMVNRAQVVRRIIKVPVAITEHAVIGPGTNHFANE